MSFPTNPLDVLRDATAWLQAGQPTRAREALSELIRVQPGNAQAHRLLALALLQTGESVRAQKELRACLRLQPDDANTLVLLARALSATGQVTEATRVLRDVLQHDALNVAAVCAFARLLLTHARVDESLRVMQPFAKRGQQTAEFWMLYGHALLQTGRAEEAVDAFRQWLQQEPDNPQAKLRLAGALADSGKPGDAEAMVHTAVAQAGNSPDAAFILGRALIGQGRFEEAEVELRNVVRAKPDHIVAQNNLSELVWMRTGDPAAAGAEIDAALRAQPRLSALRISQARLLLSARQAERALTGIEAGLALDERDPELLKSAATVAINFDGSRALHYAQRAVQVAPDDREAWADFGDASLAVGHAHEALKVAESLRQQDATDGQALAMQADALRMLGDSRYRELLDYRRLVRAAPIDAPEGWTSLAAYLAELMADLERLHTAHAHPIGNSLRDGSQVQLTPQQSPFASIRAFPRAIDGPIRRYMAAIGHGPDPMRCRNTDQYGISGMWSVRLRPNGFHVNHYHPRGWISSACYLHLPPAVQAGHGEGWLQFGEPAYPTWPALPPEYFVKPEPGLLVLFPSYMWHGTVPFSSAEDDSRLTIAFDVLPAAAPVA